MSPAHGLGLLVNAGHPFTRPLNPGGSHGSGSTVRGCKLHFVVFQASLGPSHILTRSASEGRIAVFPRLHTIFPRLRFGLVYTRGDRPILQSAICTRSETQTPPCKHHERWEEVLVRKKAAAPGAFNSVDLSWGVVPGRRFFSFVHDNWLVHTTMCFGRIRPGQRRRAPLDTPPVKLCLYSPDDPKLR